MPGRPNSTSGVVGVSAMAWPRPWGRNTTSPGPTGTGSPSAGMTTPPPSRTAWNPAASCAGNRMPHGAAGSVREACGRPVRMAAMTSLSTSTPRAYGGRGPGRDDRASPPDPGTWAAGPAVPSVGPDRRKGNDMKLAVFGASGFTGGLVTGEARRRGLSPVLVGRNGDRLRKAAVAAGVADAEVRVATLDDPAALPAAFADCDAVVSAVGPFTLWGEPVLRAALAAGCHYVDTAGEQGWIKHVLDTAGPAAERAGVSVVPAMADDGGPGDLIAHLTAGRLTDVADLLVADARPPGAASRGTARSMVAATDAVPLEYADGAWRPAAAGERRIGVPGEAEEVVLTPFPLPGVVTVPRHVRARRVRAGIRAEVARLFTALTPDAVDSVPEVLDARARSGSRW